MARRLCWKLGGGAVVVACGVTASAVRAQGPVRLEFRLVPQVGTPAATPPGVTDLPPTSAASPLNVAGVQRFELQYRVLDLDPTDVIVPAGLAAALVDFTVSGSAGGTLERAPLSRFERQTNSATNPPGPVDTSGPSTSENGARSTGLHSPFRGGMADQSNNTLPANGTMTAQGIERITPLSIAPSNQGNANIGADSQWWYGLYSFNYLPAAGATGFVTVVVMVEPDAQTGNGFAFYNDGFSAPVPSASFAGATAYLAVLPGPGVGLVLGCGASVFMGRRRRSSAGRWRTPRPRQQPRLHP
jgi:hypothetical protein